MKKLYLLLVLICVASVSYALPGSKQYRAVWNASTASDHASYKLYFRPVGGVFTDACSVECATNVQLLSGVVPDRSEITVTDIDTSGNESDFSAIVPFDKDSSAPAALTGLSVEQVP